jgi:hypothetical protein
VIISAARLSLCFSAFSKRSAKSTLPLSSLFTTTTFIPHMEADYSIASQVLFLGGIQC